MYWPSPAQLCLQGTVCHQKEPRGNMSCGCRAGLSRRASVCLSITGQGARGHVGGLCSTVGGHTWPRGVAGGMAEASRLVGTQRRSPGGCWVEVAQSSGMTRGGGLGAAEPGPRCGRGTRGCRALSLPSAQVHPAPCLLTASYCRRVIHHPCQECSPAPSPQIQAAESPRSTSSSVGTCPHAGQPCTGGESCGRQRHPEIHLCPAGLSRKQCPPRQTWQHLPAGARTLRAGLPAPPPLALKEPAEDARELVCFRRPLC